MFTRWLSSVRSDVCSNELTRSTTWVLGAEPVGDLSADHRHQDLRRLQPPVLLQQHELIPFEVAVRGEQEGHVDLFAFEGAHGQGASGIERPELHEAQSIDPLERGVFRAVNDVPDLINPPLWVVMQFGDGAAIALVALAALAWRRFRLALGPGVAGLTVYFLDKGEARGQPAPAGGAPTRRPDPGRPGHRPRLPLGPCRCRLCPGGYRLALRRSQVALGLLSRGRGGLCGPRLRGVPTSPRRRGWGGARHRRWAAVRRRTVRAPPLCPVPGRGRLRVPAAAES